MQASYVVQTRQARSLTTVQRPSPMLLVRLAARPAWIGAILLTGVSFGLEVLALRQVPLSVVQPTLALGLVGLLGFAHRGLGERVGVREMLAAGLVVAGVSAAVAGAPPRSTHLHSTALAAVVYGLLGAVLLLPYVRRAAGWAAVTGAAAGDVLAALATNHLAAAVAVGLVASLAWLAVAAVCGLGAITAETSALQRLPATRVAPVVMGADVVLPVALSAVLYRTDWSSTPGGGALLAAGVALVALGAAVLTSTPTVANLQLAAAPAADSVAPASSVSGAGGPDPVSDAAKG